jgi:hypothetical protein
VTTNSRQTSFVAGSTFYITDATEQPPTFKYHDH